MVNIPDIESILRSLPDSYGIFDRLALQEVIILVDAVEKVFTAEENQNESALTLKPVLAAVLKDIGEYLAIKDLDKKIDIEGLISRVTGPLLPAGAPVVSQQPQ